MIKTGDVIWTPPGVKHWHGASANTSMRHIAIQEMVDGRNVDWLEHVTDQQYQACGQQSAALTTEKIGRVSPALEKYMQDVVLGDLWKRPALSARDRGIVTLSALVARNQATELPFYLGLALDNGVEAREISELITHLAFYSGWGNGVNAAAVAADVFAARGIAQDQIPSASPSLAPLNETAELERASRVEQQLGATVPGLVQFTTQPLFRDLWQRPDLAPRDRSLVTVSALIASGQVAQIPYHLNRAMDNGLTQAQASEVIAHLAFYAGWPNAFSAAPAAKEVFEQRTRQP